MTSKQRDALKAELRTLVDEDTYNNICNQIPKRQRLGLQIKTLQEAIDNRKNQLLHQRTKLLEDLRGLDESLYQQFNDNEIVQSMPLPNQIDILNQAIKQIGERISNLEFTHNNLIQQLKSLNPSALNNIRKRLNDCEYLEEEIELLKQTIDDEISQLKTTRDALIEQLKSRYPNAYDDIADTFEDNDYGLHIQTIRDVLANEEEEEERKRQQSIQQQQTLPNISLSQTKHNMTQQQGWHAPQFFNGSQELKRVRNTVHDRLQQYPLKTKDLNKAMSNIVANRERMNGIRRNINQDRLEEKIKYGKTGMGKNELQHILLDLKQDIKQIKEAQSLQSANNWLAKHNLGNRLEALETDLNGDQIPEVVVRTKKGQKPVIINGYTTVDSTFPYRNAYYSAYPTRESRKGHTLNEYINKLYMPQYDKFGRDLVKGQEYLGKDWKQFESNWYDRENGYTKKLNPGGEKYRGRSAYQAFVAKCITPIYKAIKYVCRDFKIPKEFNLMQLAKIIWEQFALIPAMDAVYGSLVGDIEDKQMWDNLRGKKEVKNTIDSIINGYLESPMSIVEFIPAIIEMARLAGMTYIPQTDDAIADIVKATFLIMDEGGKHEHLPPYEQFNEFYNTKLNEVNPQLKQAMELAIERAITAAHNGLSLPPPSESFNGIPNQNMLDLQVDPNSIAIPNTRVEFLDQ